MKSAFSWLVAVITSVISLIAVCIFDLFLSHVFLGVFIVLGYQYAVVIGEATASYTAGYRGLGKCLMLWEAIKDTYIGIRAENILLFKIGYDSFLLCIINLSPNI